MFQIDWSYARIDLQIGHSVVYDVSGGLKWLLSRLDFAVTHYSRTLFRSEVRVVIVSILSSVRIKVKIAL